MWKRRNVVQPHSQGKLCIWLPTSSPSLQSNKVRLHCRKRFSKAKKREAKDQAKKSKRRKEVGWVQVVGKRANSPGWQTFKKEAKDVLPGCQNKQDHWKRDQKEKKKTFEDLHPRQSKEKGLSPFDQTARSSVECLSSHKNSPGVDQKIYKILSRTCSQPHAQAYTCVCLLKTCDHRHGISCSPCRWYLSWESRRPIGLASADVTAGRDTWNMETHSNQQNWFKTKIASHTKACWETGRSLVKVIFPSQGGFEKCWQLFDSLLTHNWTDDGGSARFLWSVGLFPIVQTSIDGRGYSSTNKAAWKSFDVEVWWTCLRFIVSCVFPFEWPTRMSDKESTTQRTAQGNEMVGLDGSSS